MSDAVAIVGIVTPAAVAVAGLWFGASREDRRTREQMRGEREKEIGDVLDTGAQALTEALIAFERRRARINDPDETGKAFAERLRDAQRIDKRITIRLGGENGTAKSYRKAVEDLDEISKFIYKAHGDDLDAQRTEELISALTIAQEDFLRSAHAYRMGSA